MPHFQIKLLEGKSKEQKQQLTDALVKTACELLEYQEKSFSVTIEDFTKEEWKKQVYEKVIMEHTDILYKAPGYEM